MALNVNKEWLDGYMARQRAAYATLRRKKDKSNLVQHVVDTTGYNRKAVIRLLNREDYERPKGAPKKLLPVDVDYLRQIWKKSGYICALYLEKELGAWLADYEELFPGAIPKATRKRLLSVSYKTLERELERYRAEKPIPTTSSGIQSAIKAGIDLVEFPRCVTGPGYLCFDTVCHSGKTTNGNCVHTVTVTDIYTQFCITRAVWNKGHEAMKEAITYCVKHIPFPILEVNTDNGREFLNSGVYKLWEDIVPDAKITRSRPYHKNDNAHVEQKNRTHVRDLFLRFRLEHEEYVGMMNEIYRTANLYRNYVVPCKTLKERKFDPLTKRVHRKYTDPQTPVERILASKVLDKKEMKANKEKLLMGKSKINRVKLSTKLENGLEAFFTKLKDDPAINT